MPPTSRTPGSGSREARAQPAYIRDPDSVSVSGTDPPTLPLCLSWGGSENPAESCQLAHFVSRPTLPQSNLITPALLPFVPDK